MNTEAFHMNYLFLDSKQQDMEKVHPAMTMTVSLDILNDNIVEDDFSMGNNGKSNNNCDVKEVFSSCPSQLERQRSSSPRSVSGINSASFFAKDCEMGKVIFDTDKDDDCLEVFPPAPLPLMTSVSTDLRNLMNDYLGPDVVKDILPKTKLTFYKEQRSHDIDNEIDDDIETDIETDMDATDFNTDTDDDEMTIESDSNETMLLPEWDYQNDKEDAFLKFFTLPTKPEVIKSENQSESKKMVDITIRMKKKTKQKPASKSKVTMKVKNDSATKNLKNNTNVLLKNNKLNSNNTKIKVTIKGNKEKDNECNNANPAQPEVSQRSHVDENIWNMNYMKVMAFYIKNGHSNVLRSDPDTKLSGWVKRQRNNLKGHKLTYDQIHRLEKLDFVWNRLEGAWYEKYSLLKKFQKEEGNCEVPTKFNRSLAEWSQRQRREYRIQRSTMTRVRIAKLEEIPTWSWASRTKRRRIAQRQSVQKTTPIDDSESCSDEESIVL